MNQNKILFLSMGNIGISVLNTFINTYLPLYLLSYNTNVATVILLVAAGFMLGIFLQPLSGKVSDILKNRIGTRTPIFVLFGIAVCVSIELMARAAGQHKAIYALILFSMFHIYQIPLSACIPDETAERSSDRASSYWTLMGMLGSFVVPLLAVLIWDYSKEILLDVLSYIVLGSIFIPAAFSSKNKIAITGKAKMNISDFMRSSFGKRLTKLYILKMCWWIAAGFIIPFFPIYIAYNIGISITSISLTIEVMLIISMILSVCLIKIMSIYNKKLIIVAGMVYLIIYSVILIVNRNAFIPIILMMLFSISYSILITVPLSIVYKLIPAQMRGTILGVDNIFLNLPQALSIGMAGIVYILFGINYIYIISVVFSIITIILLISYNINEPM